MFQCRNKTIALILLCSASTACLAQYHLTEGWYDYLNSNSVSDHAVAVAVDSSNNCYSFHVTVGSQTDSWVITKVAQYGNQIYQASFPRPLKSVSQKGFIALDSLGNSYVAGDFMDGTEKDIYLAKVSPTGVFVWGKTIGGAQDDYPIGLSVDTMGHCCLASNVGVGTVRELELNTFDSSGTQLASFQDPSFTPGEANFTKNEWFITGVDETSKTGGARYQVWNASNASKNFDRSIGDSLVNGTGNRYSYSIVGDAGGGWSLALSTAFYKNNAVQSQSFTLREFDNSGHAIWTSQAFPGYCQKMVGTPGSLLYVTSYDYATSSPCLRGINAAGTSIWSVDGQRVGDIAYDLQGADIYYLSYDNISGRYAQNLIRYDATGHQVWSTSYNSALGAAPVYGGMVDSSQNLWFNHTLAVNYSTHPKSFLTRFCPGIVLSDLSVPPTVAGGSTFNMTVTLVAKAPSGGVTVVLTSETPTVTFVANHSTTLVVKVPAGSSSYQVPVKANNPASATTATFHGQNAGVYRRCGTMISHT